MAIITNIKEIRMRRQYDISNDVEKFFLNHDVEILTGLRAKLGIHVVNSNIITVYVYSDLYDDICLRAESLGFKEK